MNEKNTIILHHAAATALVKIKQKMEKKKINKNQQISYHMEFQFKVMKNLNCMNKDYERKILFIVNVLSKLFIKDLMVARVFVDIQCKILV